MDGKGSGSYFPLDIGSNATTLGCQPRATGAPATKAVRGSRVSANGMSLALGPGHSTLRGRGVRKTHDSALDWHYL